MVLRGGIVLVILSALALQAWSAPGQRTVRGKRVITVQNAMDDFRRPPAGSLRDVIERRALAGDTIRFASPFVVQLKDALVIPARLTGIRIEGPAGIAGPNRTGAALAIQASGTVVTGITFQRIYLQVGRSKGRGAHDVQIVGNQFQDDSFVVLRGNGIRVENNPITNVRRESTPAIFLQDARDAVVRGNTVTGRVDTAISDSNGVNITVEDNTLSGPIDGTIRSGTIRNNTLPEHGILVKKLDEDAGIPHGRIVVDNNRATQISVGRGNAEVTGNTVALPASRNDGTAGIRVISEKARLGAGPCLISGNTVTGGFTGLSVAQQAGAARVEVRQNQVSGAGVVGISASGADLLIAGNTATDCGVGFVSGAGIKVSAIGSGVMLQTNTITGCATGLRVATKAAGHRVQCTAATITGSGIRGVEVPSGPGRVTLTDCIVRNNNFGVGYFAGRGEVIGGEVSGSTGAGIFIAADCQVKVSQVVTGGNGGPGIDLAPLGVTSNAQRKTANGDLDWPEQLEFDGAAGKVKGRTIPGGVVEVYGVETGPRAGNPQNGEGSVYLGTVVADSQGRFSWPESGAAECPPSEKFTLTVTKPGANPVTSEFSPDVKCERTGFTELVSVDSQETIAIGGHSTFNNSGAPSRQLTPDGRYVVFTSRATNLVPNDTNDAMDVFVRDRVAGTTERVSVSTSGAQATITPGGNQLGFSDPAISADGRWVVFTSNGDNLVEGDVNGNTDVFLRDRQNGITLAVTDPTEHSPPLPNGRSTHNGGYYATISGDGRFVAFVSPDRNWVANDTNNSDDVFVYHRETGVMERVSVSSSGGQGGGGVAGGGLWPRMSHDGRFVVFGSALSNLTDDVITRRGQIYLRDRLNATTELISKSTAGTSGNQLATVASVSDDGRVVAFSSASSNLVDGDTDGVSDVFVRDRQLATTQLVSVQPGGAAFTGACISPSLSGDGKTVAFTGPGGHVFPDGPAVLFNDIYLRDLTTGLTEEIGLGPQGDANNACGFPCLGTDGRFVVFQTAATNLLPADGTADTNEFEDIYFRDRGTPGIEPPERGRRAGARQRRP